MSAAAAVTIVAAALVVLVLAGFLLAIARVLAHVDRQLGTVVGAVAEIARRTEPVAGVVESIDRNLDDAAGTLTDLLERKVGAEGAAALIASVDPLATNGRGAEPAEAQPQEEEPRSPFSAGGPIRLRTPDEP